VDWFSWSFVRVVDVLCRHEQMLEDVDILWVNIFMYICELDKLYAVLYFE
jgi:hypothetical protein